MGAIRRVDVGGWGGRSNSLYKGYIVSLVMLYCLLAVLKGLNCVFRSHVAFHLVFNGIYRIGVSSSSGCIRVRSSGVRPL